MSLSCSLHDGIMYTLRFQTARARATGHCGVRVTRILEAFSWACGCVGAVKGVQPGATRPHHMFTPHAAVQ